MATFSLLTDPFEPEPAMETIEHVIRANGTIGRRVVTEHDIPIQNNVLATLTAGTPVPVQNITNLKELGLVQLMVKTPLYYVSARLPVVKFKTVFHVLDKEKVMVPVFAQDKAMMSIAWAPPEDMDLRFNVSMSFNPPGSHSHWPQGYFQLSQAHLFAFSKEKRCYKLPLPNIYADGRICLGNTRVDVKSNMVDLFLTVHQLFCDAPWGTDLWEDVETTQKLIRLQPEKDGFKSLPPLAQWTTLSAVIANDLTQLLTPTI